MCAEGRNSKRRSGQGQGKSGALIVIIHVECIEMSKNILFFVYLAMFSSTINF